MTHFNNTKKAEEIFREKKVVKNPIKFKIQLNDEQKEAKQLILDNTITLISRSSRFWKNIISMSSSIRRITKKNIRKNYHYKTDRLKRRNRLPTR